MKTELVYLLLTATLPGLPWIPVRVVDVTFRRAVGGLSTHSVTLEKQLVQSDQGAEMSAAKPVREYQESRIEDEPILGAVLVLPSGTIQPLTLWERVLVKLRLTSAKSLE